MEWNQQEVSRMLQRAVFMAGIATVAGTEPVLAAPMGHVTVERPEAAEFGIGPRVSAQRLYRVTLQPATPLRLRQTQSVPLLITDASGRPIENATVTVDGGMPEHHHGLPTKPRVKRVLGGGLYEIEGVRFSMGGWWEVKLKIESPAGSDRVTFNLSL